MLDSHCANCLVAFTPQNNGEASHVKSNMLCVDLSLKGNEYSTGENIQDISVAEALSSIFHMPFTTAAVSQEQVHICDSCNVHLRSLFIHFKHLFHRQRKESFISQTIAHRTRTSHNKNKNKNTNTNKSGVNNKSTQTQTNYNLDCDSFMKTQDDDPRYPQVEIKVEAEDPLEFDEYSDPLQMQDVNFNGAEEMEHVENNNNDNNKSDSRPTRSNSKTRNKKRSAETKKCKNKVETHRTVVDDGLPTFEALYNLPSVDRYSPFRLKSLEPPFKSPCKCEERIFVTYNHYREHVSEKHLHFEIFKCEQPSVKPGANPEEVCGQRTRKFELYYKHCVKNHQVKPVEPKAGWPDLDEVLNKYLMPEFKSEEEESNHWCFLHPQLVKKIKHELKPPASTTSTQVNSEGESTTTTSNSKSRSKRRTGEIPPPPYKCVKCYVDPPAEFQLLESYIMHMGKNLHETRVFTCAQCSREFSGKSNDSLFIQHCKKVHNSTPDLSTSPNKVKIMDKTFQLEQEKDRQRISYKPVLELLGDPPYSCPQNHNNGNEGPFNCMADFWTHLKTAHFSKKEFICPKCAKSFTSKRGWDNHVDKFCGRKKKKIEKRFLPPFICSLCQPPREFPNRPALTVHISATHSEKNYVCEVCGNGFTTKGRLTEHRKFHGTDYPAVCEICGRSYKTNGNLRMHLRISHSEEGRLKYNAYCRLKNQKRKMKMAGQNPNQHQNSGKLDVEMQVDDSEQEFEESGNSNDNSMNTE